MISTNNPTSQNRLITARSLTGFLFSLFLLLSAGPVMGQTSQDISDFRNMRVSELSDDQIGQINDRLDEEGLTLQQAEQMAISRGMSSAEASRLRNRLRQYQSGQLSSSDGSNDRQPETTRAPADNNSFMVFLEDEDENMIEEAGIDWDRLTQRQRVTILDSLRRDNQSVQRIFGYNLFSQRSVSFAPSLSIPTPKNYQLGPGDEVVINIWGAAENRYNLTVGNDGTIDIPSIGPIQLNGYSIEEAEKRLIERLKSIYSGLGSTNNPNRNTYADVTVGKVRSISVTLMGEVKQPGTYTMPSLATVFNALYAAGGPNRNGTFRNIQIIRGNGVMDTLDIYDFLIDGDQSNNIRLQDQDIIKIDPFENRVDFSGEVKRSALFELKEDETLADLLRFSGGFTDKAYRARVNVRQITDRERRVQDVYLENFDQYVMNNGDQVNVGEVLDRYENRVEINGAVYRPGPYELKNGTTLFSLIERADGLKDDVFMNRALIVRERNNLELETIAVNLRNVMDDPAHYDIPLHKNDVIRISSIFDLRESYHVTIAGAVRDGQIFDYTDGMTLEDLVFKAGGFSESAAPYRIDVARRKTKKQDGERTNEIAETFEFSVNRDLSLSENDADFTLQPFDRVYVRRAPGYQEQQQVEITGQVMFPGTYTITRKNETIYDLIERAGGLTEDAFLGGANLQRTPENLAAGDSIETEEIAQFAMDQAGEEVDEG
ncbi:MAG: SLBB domain-containing protein, partial [Balneolales bacterium]